jgi:hypothetical protein
MVLTFVKWQVAVGGEKGLLQYLQPRSTNAHARHAQWHGWYCLQYLSATVALDANCAQRTPRDARSVGSKNWNPFLTCQFRDVYLKSSSFFLNSCSLVQKLGNYGRWVSKYVAMACSKANARRKIHFFVYLWTISVELCGHGLFQSKRST